MEHMPMGEITADRFDTVKGVDWNSFVESSNEGTLFHRLDFLAYHRERFRGKEHHLAFRKKASVIGLMPMAIISQNARLVYKSPYGGSYGGPIFSRPLNYEDSKGVIEALLSYLIKVNPHEIEMTLPVFPCYRVQSDTFRFALLETGFCCVNRDISSVVCLDPTNPMHEQIQKRLSNLGRKARKAVKEGVELGHRAPVDDIWRVMEATFHKHETKPTHSREELRWLTEKFPERIYADVGYLAGKPIAGVMFFVVNSRVVCSFYLLQDPDFQKTQALSLLLYSALLRCQESGFRWFDLGTSSVGMIARPGVFRFKENFGALGVFRETYKFSLRDTGKD
jgi:hypothetical protein